MLILGHFLSQQLPYDICCILGTGPSQMRPANCNMKQLTHLESKKRAHGFEQYVTNSIKESTFLMCLPSLYLSTAKLSVENTVTVS